VRLGEKGKTPKLRRKIGGESTHGKMHSMLETSCLDKTFLPVTEKDSTIENVLKGKCRI